MNVQFSKKKIKSFSSEDSLAFDCHFHSKYSDGSSSIEKILLKAKQKGIGVAITDHNEIQGAVEAYNNDLGVPVIPGIEVSCKGMIHMLLYFYEIEDLQDFYYQYVEPNKRINPNTALKRMTAYDIAHAAKRYKCIITLAHPYSGIHRGIESYCKSLGDKACDFISMLHVIESFNGTVSKKNNQKSYNLALSENKKIIGGSDGHTLGALGNVVTVAKCKDAHSFLDQVSQGCVEVMGKTVNVYQQCKTAGISSFKHFHASTKKHHQNILVTLGLFAVFQRVMIPFLFLAGATAYKKVREKKLHKHL